MSQISPFTMDDDTVIYIETSENVAVVEADETKNKVEEPLVSKGNVVESAVQKFKSIEGTIKTYTNHTLNAFREVAAANVDKVTLEFGIKVGGEAGIPYVTKGTAESNLKITVECSFRK
ncbi:CU044_2847 family protein [uncultured Desulfobacter sp.]|uniref:CU044_2847 family protein n=1 Tax=uncultured Desulfobacter sp. TaxID=240139 RepID=UPI002A188A55|nr:CU044_2847 family protein [uncultured Desulfobacter sp.]